MDLLTLAVFGAFVAVLVARVLEIAVKRPQTFLELTGDLRKFAEPTAFTAGSAGRSGEVIDLPRRPLPAAAEDYRQRRSA